MTKLMNLLLAVSLAVFLAILLTGDLTAANPVTNTLMGKKYYEMCGTHAWAKAKDPRNCAHACHKKNKKYVYEGYHVPLTRKVLCCCHF